MTITIHAVFHAHLDPIWMWPWTSGLDEAMATARSACDRLAAHPELFYTSGEIWPMAMIERADPRLWRRIVALVKAGRWEVGNAWWTQPDCNFPTATGLRRNITDGCAWARARFGELPLRTAFNPDSFGHCAALPDILRSCGQDRYVFMRPQEHEMTLPARLFTWRSRPGGPGVTAFRIGATYLNGNDGISTHPIERACADLPPDVTHTMTFFGIGDHGGGPTERLVRWVEDHRDCIPGARMVFSTVERFFAAIEAERPQLPEVIGELQQHAVGCYSVVRSQKIALRRAEHSLDRAAAVALPDELPLLDAGWKAAIAHQFHDTTGGSCIPEAYRGIEDQLGGATAAADEILTYAVRRQLVDLPDDSLPRLILANPGHDHFSGWCEGTIYVEGVWKRDWRLLDQAGLEVPFQRMHPGIGIVSGWNWDVCRVLVRRDIAASALAVLRLDLSQEPQVVTPQVTASAEAIHNLTGVGVTLMAGGAVLSRPGRSPLPLDLLLFDDDSDTWSHGRDRLASGPWTGPAWQAPRVIDRGPLMASLQQDGRIGDSRLRAEWRVCADEATVELILDVWWCEQQRILKLVMPLAGETMRRDGTPGMGLERANDGREMPLQDWLQTATVAVVCPDVWAADATPERARLTLLRSPWMAFHEPGPAEFPRAETADQGMHRFRFRFDLGATDDTRLTAAARALHRPPLIAELTRGMPARYAEYGPQVPT